LPFLQGWSLLGSDLLSEFLAKGTNFAGFAVNAATTATARILGVQDKFRICIQLSFDANLDIDFLTVLFEKGKAVVIIDFDFIGQNFKKLIRFDRFMLCECSQ
jgi:hypothetical protein